MHIYICNWRYSRYKYRISLTWSKLYNLTTFPPWYLLPMMKILTLCQWFQGTNKLSSSTNMKNALRWNVPLRLLKIRPSLWYIFHSCQTDTVFPIFCGPIRKTYSDVLPISWVLQNSFLKGGTFLEKSALVNVFRILYCCLLKICLACRCTVQDENINTPTVSWSVHAASNKSRKVVMTSKSFLVEIYILRTIFKVPRNQFRKWVFALSYYTDFSREGQFLALHSIPASRSVGKYNHRCVGTVRNGGNWILFAPERPPLILISQTSDQ